MLEIFLALFGKKQIACLVADREFVGLQWLRWLRQEWINFHLRVHANYRVTHGRGHEVAAYQLFRATRVNTPLVIKQPRQMWGKEWYFSGRYLGRGEYLLLVSTTCAAEAVAQYARRWGIETLFAALKTRGFCLEVPHLRDPQRLDRLVALLALAFCCCHKLGEWLHQQKALPLKKHGRKPKSLFRRGFDYLRRLIVNFTNIDPVAWQNVINLLSCT